MRTAFVPIALFTASFLAVSGLLRSFQEWPTSSGLRAKVQHYEADPEGFDVVFVGSSNAMCSILPPLFEAEMAARGHALRAYNLGLPGMLSFETDHMARRVLAGRGERLRTVFLELTEWRPDPRLADSSERSVYWHTPERAAVLLRTALASESLEPAQALGFARDHLELTLWRLANLGSLQRPALRRLGLIEPDAWELAVQPSVEGGFLALEELDNEGARQGRQRFLARLPRYQAQVQALRRQWAASGANEPPAHSLPGARAQAALFEGTGVEPIHLLFATAAMAEGLEALGGEDGPLEELWAFNDPRRFPELFQLDARYDSRHLNRAGAEALTRLLAERYARHLDGARD